MRKKLMLAVALAALACPVAAAGLEGQATVIDGDTFDLAGQRICLHGINASERSRLFRRDA